MGVTDQPVPAGVVGIGSVDIGNSTLAQLAADGSNYAADVANTITHLRKLERLLGRLPLP